MRRLYFHAIKLRVTILLGIMFLCLAAYTTYTYYINKVSFQAVEALSWSISQKLIVIDPGHGGVDPGAIGKAGTIEKHINLAVAKRLAAALSQGGAAVVMTRESDVDLSSHQGGYTKRKREDLENRAEIANQRKADLFISIHLNSFPSSRWSGAQTFYHPDSPQSKQLAELIQNEFIHTLKNTTRKALGNSDYAMLNKTNMPAVIVELGFLSNPREESLLNDDSYQTKLAWCMYAGIVKYFAESQKANSR